MWSTLDRTRRRLLRVAGHATDRSASTDDTSAAAPDPAPTSDVVIAIGRPELERLGVALQTVLGPGTARPDTPARLEAALADAIAGLGTTVASASPPTRRVVHAGGLAGPPDRRRTGHRGLHPPSHPRRGVRRMIAVSSSSAARPPSARTRRSVGAAASPTARRPAPTPSCRVPDLLPTVDETAGPTA